MLDQERTHYQRVIVLMASSKVDYQKVALALALESPQAFMAFHEGAKPTTGLETLSKHEQELLTMRDNKIMAIKRRREVTGEGLKEAKDFVDALFARADRGDFKPKDVVSLGELLKAKLEVKVNPDEPTTEEGPLW